MTTFATVLTSYGQTAVWTPGAANTNYTNPANWVGGVVPPSNGTYTLGFNYSPSGQDINVNANENVLGLSFTGSDSYFTQYNLTAGGGALTIGAGGIVQTGNGESMYTYAPIVLSASQTWNSANAFIFDIGGISETGGSRMLTIGNGTLYLGSNNSFSGGITMMPNTYLNISSNGFGGSATLGSGTLVLESGSTVGPWNYNAVVSNAVSLGSSVKIGGYGYLNNYDTITFSGALTETSASSVVNLSQNATAILSGTLTGPSSTQLSIQGNGSNLPNDGGSLLVVNGSLSNIAGVSITNAQVILAPAGSSSSAFSSVQAGGLTVGTDSGPGYLGLDGTFANAGAVTTFLTTYGAGIGGTINGTLGFDSYGLGTTNVFNDPINLANFSSPNFTGLGTSTTAVLSSTAVITPPTSGPQANDYVFGGGGGTLYLRSTLVGTNGLVMNYANEPLTVLVQGAGAFYTGGTTANGGVLIFDAPAPVGGAINLAGEAYVGFTENAANVASSQAWVNLFLNSPTVGVIGFDSTIPGSPRTVTDPIDLSNFTLYNSPFLGTATAVTLNNTITPFNGNYWFTGVKGGTLTVESPLVGTNAVTIGLYTPLENNGSVSTVVLTNTSATPNTYSGGTTLNSGTLAVGNSGVLGSGPIAVSEPGPVTVNPVLMAATGSSSVALSNDITVGSSSNANIGLTLGNPSTSDELVLTGAITDGSSPGAISIQGAVALNGTNGYTGGTSLVQSTLGYSNAQLYVNNPASLGLSTSTLNVAASGSLIPEANFTLSNPISINGYSTLTVGAPGCEYTLTLAGVISGNPGYLDIESATVINGANTYSGSTSINNAIVTLGSAGTLGTGTVYLNNSTLNFGSATPTLTDLSSSDSSSIIGLQPGSNLTLYTDNLDGQEEFAYSGQINGDAATRLTKTGPGTEVMAGASVYAAGTTVSQGTLIAGSANALGTGPVTVQSGAQFGVASAVTFTNNVILDNGGGLSGAGTFQLPTATDLANGSFVMPGSAVTGQYVGALSFTNSVTFDVGGLYVFDLANAGGAAGNDYSTLYVTGALYISANAGSPFTIKVVSIGSDGRPGTAVFNPALSYSWTLATSAGGIAFFNASDFVVDASLFQNSTNGGSFAVGESGNTLTLNFTPVPEPGEWALMIAGCAMMGAWALRRRVA